MMNNLINGNGKSKSYISLEEILLSKILPFFNYQYYYCYVCKRMFFFFYKY